MSIGHQANQLNRLMKVNLEEVKIVSLPVYKIQILANSLSL